MKFIVALCLFSSLAHAGQFIDFKCTSLDASHIFKLNATGTIELDLNDTSYQESHAWMEASLTDAGFNSVARLYSNIELVGKSRLVVDQTKFPFYHVQLKPVGDSEIAHVNLSIGFPNPIASYIRLKSGHEYRGKCEIK